MMDLCAHSTCFNEKFASTLPREREREMRSQITFERKLRVLLTR